MVKFGISTKTRHPQAAVPANTFELGMHGVLSQGYIIHAYASGTMARIVTFAQPDAYFRSFQKRVQPAAEAITYFGSGETAEHAFRHALFSFANDLSYEEAVKHFSTDKGATSPTGRLDRWLLLHKGTLHAVCDEDGMVICRLEGLAKPTGVGGWVSAEGVADSFKRALLNAFAELS
jgi:hypothetical protein